MITSSSTEQSGEITFPTECYPENEFNLYVGSKIIKAKPMTSDQFQKEIKGVEPDRNQETVLGYLVEYPDSYLSWSPKEVFEEAYRKISLKEKELISPNLNY